MQQATLITPEEFRELNVAAIVYLLRTHQLDHLRDIQLARHQIEEIWEKKPELTEALVHKQIISSADTRGS